MGEQNVIASLYNMTMSRLQQEGCQLDYRGTSQLKEGEISHMHRSPWPCPFLFLDFQ